MHARSHAIPAIEYGTADSESLVIQTKSVNFKSFLYIGTATITFIAGLSTIFLFNENMIFSFLLLPWLTGLSIHLIGCCFPQRYA